MADVEVLFVDHDGHKRKNPDPNCGWCGGKGVVDSGGTTPWGAEIDVACSCTYVEEPER